MARTFFRTTAACFAMVAVAACSTTTTTPKDTPIAEVKISVPRGTQVGVILPDPDPSQRFGSDDPRFLRPALSKAGLSYTIEYAQNDKQRFLGLAQAMVKAGVKVLAIVNPDSDSGKAAIDLAHDAGVKTIDYDRLTLNGYADFYVSFDNAQVGKLQADGLVRCLNDRRYKNPVVAELNGSLTDYNADLLKSGYDRVLQPKYDNAVYTKGPDQFVPDWSVSEAEKIFAQMWDAQPRIRGVLAANDGLAGSAIKILKQQKMNGKVPVTGQDATLAGVRNVLTGDQCLTVYKSIGAEAEALARTAKALVDGTTPADASTIKDPISGAYVPAVLLKPAAIFKEDIHSLIESKFLTRATLCAGSYGPLCDELDKGAKDDAAKDDAAK